MPDPDLITRIDRAIAELQAIRAEVVASMPHGMPRSDSGEAVGEVSGRDGLDADSDFRPESLIEISTAVERASTGRRIRCAGRAGSRPVA